MTGGTVDGKSSSESVQDLADWERRYSQAATQTADCPTYVAQNPGAFTNAYWSGESRPQSSSPLKKALMVCSQLPALLQRRSRIPCRCRQGRSLCRFANPEPRRPVHVAKRHWRFWSKLQGRSGVRRPPLGFLLFLLPQWTLPQAGRLVLGDGWCSGARRLIVVPGNER